MYCFKRSVNAFDAMRQAIRRIKESVIEERLSIWLTSFPIKYTKVICDRFDKIVISIPRATHILFRFISKRRFAIFIPYISFMSLNSFVKQSINSVPRDESIANLRKIYIYIRGKKYGFS